MNRRAIPLLVLSLPWAMSGCGESRAPQGEGLSPDAPIYRSPAELAFSPDGRWLAVGDVTAKELVAVSVPEGRVAWRTKLAGRPAGIVWSADGQLVYAAVGDRGEVVEVEAASGSITRRVPTGGCPTGLALAPDSNLLLVADEASAQLIVLDRDTGRQQARIAVVRSPWGGAISPQRQLVVVGNRLPDGDASRQDISAVVSLVELTSFARLADIMLPANSTNLRGVAVSPGGRWAYVVHTIARTTWPAVQIEYGGISANALSIIDLTEHRRHATVLLDQTEQGCANPWGVAVAADGKSLWLSISGTHQLARLDLEQLHAELEKRAGLLAFLRLVNRKGPLNERLLSQRSSAVDDPTSVELVVSEKPTIYRHGVGCACGMGIYLPRVIRRFALPCEGPRGVALSPDGATAAVAGYFSGTVIIFDARTGREQQNDLVQREIALGPQPPTNAIRRGESAFHDARLCYQQWLACATCHPEGRTDGLNWDLMNDGVNNPKNTRSLVLAHLAGPMMARGVRGGFAEAVAAGFEHVLFRPAPEAVRRDVEAYLCSLRPHPSPALVEGNLSAAARMGKGLFESAEVGCAECHCGPLLTDAKMHDVGTQTESDWEEENAFLTPKLVESWRTAPYLHHGKAGTLREVLTKYNRADRHGRTSHLKDVEIDALVEYLRSL